MSLIITEEAGIQRASTEEQIRSCHRVMQQLRPHLTDEQTFVEQVQRQLAEGYHLAYCQDKGEVKKRPWRKTIKVGNRSREKGKVRSGPFG